MLKLAIVGNKNFERQDWVEKFAQELPSSVKAHLPTMPGVSLWVEEQLRLMPGGQRPVMYAIPRHNGERTKEEFLQLAQNRNRQLVQEAEAVVFFWDGDEPNSRHVWKCAIELGRPIYMLCGKEPDIALELLESWVRRLANAPSVVNGMAR